jgi:hypothetical protein
MENKRRYLSLVVLGDTRWEFRIIASINLVTVLAKPLSLTSNVFFLLYIILKSERYVSRRAVTNSKETKTPSFVMKDLFIEDIPISVQVSKVTW